MTSALSEIAFADFSVYWMRRRNVTNSILRLQLSSERPSNWPVNNHFIDKWLQRWHRFKSSQRDLNLLRLSITVSFLPLAGIWFHVWHNRSMPRQPSPFEIATPYALFYVTFADRQDRRGCAPNSAKKNVMIIPFSWS